jgi:lysyl-tRNA synthetase class 1
MSDRKYRPYISLNFRDVDRQAQKFADIIESRLDALSEILLRYESYEVVTDEISRTLDLLRNLKENKKYFQLRVGAIASFLPRNQPLYAFSCFVVVPSLMASEVHFRIPHNMKGFFHDMLTLLDVSKLFPNVIPSTKERLEFVMERSAMLINPQTKETRPSTDVVIFTGATTHVEQLRTVFDRRTLFIVNGAGHNPVVVSKDADLCKAVETVISLQFYNQGQDCSAPNAILVSKTVLSNFMSLLRSSVKLVKIGHYQDRSCRIGPISDPRDLVRIEDFLMEHRAWLDHATPGIIRTRDAIIEPTIISKPLIEGGNFKETFAPVIFIQEYNNDSDLKYYFEDPHYAYSSMYISLYGESKYVEGLIGRSIRGKVLHDKKSILRNTDPHVRGFERGTKPYGGYGYGASSISFNGKTTSMPTLPQRDIYNMCVKSILRKKNHSKQQQDFNKFTKIEYKNVQNILKSQLSSNINDTHISKYKDTVYFDSDSLRKVNTRYVKLGKNNTYSLLSEPNLKYISGLTLEDIKMIRTLKRMILKKPTVSLDKFRALIYAIPKDPQETNMINKERQSIFFQHIYQLLLGKKFGPQLASFILDIDREQLGSLLAV